jgi:hypothetical protein
MKPFQLVADGLGLIVPMNIEALCVGKQKEAVFQSSPYDFSLLPDSTKPGPFIAEKIKSGGLGTLEIGVHLHWALPDGMTKGEGSQGSSDGIQFPAAPDRWLVTRVCTNSTGSGQHQLPL